ncbi:MAG TPA: PAS domain S-box protein [Chiayiivirga sp.]|nr:PAS domain S-box protein [Chiayiivirga sp.]
MSASKGGDPLHGLAGSGANGVEAQLELPVPEHVRDKWRDLLDLVAEAVGGCAGRIMRIAGSDMEVLALGGAMQDRYRVGERIKLANSPFYGASVITGRACLLVGDASVDSRWGDNPNRARGMVSCIGYPVLWPDGSPFGVIDVLDRQSNSWSVAQQRLLAHFRDTIETDLAMIWPDSPNVLSMVAALQREREALRLSEERFRLLVEHAGDDFFLHDDKGRFLDVNERACQSTGYSREELLQMSVIDLSLDFSQQEQEEIWKGMEPGTATSVYSHHRRKDGTVFPVEIRISCHLIRGQKLFIGMVRDITERVESEQVLQRLNAELERRVVERTRQWRKSADLLQAVIDGATDAIFLKDREGRILLFNRAAATFVGRPVEDILGKTIAELFGPTASDAIREIELEVMASGKASTIEETLPMKGGPRLFLATRSPYRDGEGNIIGLIGISRDITEKKRAEEALRDSEARWQFAVDGAGDGIWDWDIPSSKVFYSRQWKAMLGYADEEVGNTLEDWSSRVHPDDFDRCQQAVESHLRGDTPDFVFEYRMRAKDGSWCWVLSRGKTVERGAGGGSLRVIGTHTNITERKLAEEELRIQRERLMLAAAANQIGVWEYSLDDDTILCDERCHAIFDIDSSTSANDVGLFIDRVHPDDIDGIRHDWQDAFSTQRKLHHSNFRIVTPSGETRWISSSACFIERNELTPRRFVGIAMDVTQSRLTEAKLKRSLGSLRRAEKLAKIGSWTLDLASGEFLSSDTLYEMNGMDPDGPPLTLGDLRKLLAPESCQRVMEAIARCAETGEAYGIDAMHMRPDGTSFAVHIRGQAGRDSTGKITSLNGTVQDITESEEARARLVALADNLPSGTIYRIEHDPDGNGTMSYVSASVQRLVGLSAVTIIDDVQAFMALIHEDDLPHYLELQRKALETRMPFDCQFRVRGRDGEERWMHCRSAPSVVRADGSSVWDGIMRDITDERLAAEALKEAKEAAEQAERAKGNFLSTMSHEIRTPMNTVIGMTRLTLQTDLSARQRNYLEKVDASARMLLSIINDVLDFSKIEAGRIDLEDTGFTLDSVLESVSAATAMRAEEKGLEMVFAVAPDVPRQLRGDPLRLGQVLNNLVGNAVKFTLHGEVVVSIGLVVEDGVERVWFDVRDTGIGLDGKQIARLFLPFFQADATISRHYGGTGLGLAISKQLVEAMGGAIHVESEPGQGSSFRFTIGAGHPDGASEPDTPLPCMRGLEGRRALVVDDNERARHALLDMLHGFGMEAVAAASGDEGIDVLQAASRRGEAFDVVLMDWRMPGMDGIESAWRFRADESLGHVPTVLMTMASAQEDVFDRADQLGLEGVLIKPVIESALHRVLVDAVSGHASAAPASLSGHDPVVPQRRSSVQAFAALSGRRVLVVDDNAFNREVARDFLMAAGVDVDTAADGRDALKQLAANDYDAVLMDVHMPEMDGIAATREIRRHARWANLPIVALTAQARIEDREAGLDVGMTAHLTKPIDEGELYKTLLEVIPEQPVPGARGGSDDGAEVSGANTPPVPARELDMAVALRLTGGDPDRVHRMMRGFARDFGDAEVRLDEALQRGSFQEIAALAHLLRGAASYFGAPGFCSAADRLEQSARCGDSGAAEGEIPAFRHGIRVLLGEIVDSLAGARQCHAIGGDIDFEAVLALIADIEPLLVRGDHAAQALLENICTRLAGSRDTALAESILAQFEKLELAEAGVALLRLKNRLLIRQAAVL